MNEVQEPDRVPMSRRERDVLAVMRGVLSGERTQVEAARWLKKSVRQVRRMQRRMEADGDAALVHGLRGRPSNHQRDPTFRTQVLAAYRQQYADFGPTFAVEKLADDGSSPPAASRANFACSASIIGNRSTFRLASSSIVARSGIGLSFVGGTGQQAVEPGQVRPRNGDE